MQTGSNKNKKFLKKDESEEENFAAIYRDLLIVRKNEGSQCDWNRVQESSRKRVQSSSEERTEETLLSCRALALWAEEPHHPSLSDMDS